jgi:hypothetical protein
MAERGKHANICILLALTASIVVASENAGGAPKNAIASVATTETAYLGDNRTLRAERVHWDRLTLEARKFFLSADSTIRLTILDRKQANAQLIEPRQGEPIALGTRAVRIDFLTNLIGRSTDTAVWMDPVNGAALQYEAYDRGSKYRYRVYRYTDSGAYQTTRQPLEGEKDLSWQDWSDTSEGFRQYPSDVQGNVIVEPAGLLYILAASNLSDPGDRLEFFGYMGNDIVRVVLSVDERSIVEADFKTTGSTGHQRCRGDLSTLRIRVNGYRVSDGSDAGFDFLGLEKDVEVFLDPVSRLPAQITGRIRILGRLTIRLKEAHNIGQAICPTRP